MKNEITKNALTDLLYAMFKASDAGDGNAAEEAHSELRVMMQKMYPDIEVDSEMFE